MLNMRNAACASDGEGVMVMLFAAIFLPTVIKQQILISSATETLHLFFGVREKLPMSATQRVLSVGFLVYLLLASTRTSTATIQLPSSSTDNSTFYQPHRYYTDDNSTNVSADTKCIIPSPLDPSITEVNLARCHDTFNALLTRPDSYVPKQYLRLPKRTISISKAPCAISMDAKTQNAPIKISFGDIVSSARRILVLCDRFNLGGWERVVWDPYWVVIVMGHDEFGGLLDGDSGIMNTTMNTNNE